MIKLTPDELKRFKPVSNMILVKPNRGNDEILVGDHKLYLDISFNREVHSPVMGAIVAVPAQLNPKQMQWDVDMEARPGDVAWYSYLAAQCALAPEMGRMIMCDGEVYFLIPYEEVFVVKRTCSMFQSAVEITAGRYSHVHVIGMDQASADVVTILPVNGYCLVEPVEEKEEWKIGKLVLERPEMSKGFHSARYGKVAHVSTGLIRKYNDGDGIPDQDLVRPGDYICFDTACDLIVEYDLHAQLEGKKMFYRMQRRYIHATIPQDLVSDIQ
jgi:hypothetical protein